LKTIIRKINNDIHNKATMVKNSTGGNKSKGFARKNLSKRDSALRVAREEGEIYAQAVKVMGGSIASAIDVNGNLLRAHIRGKFRGRGKRDNFIGPGTWLLVGLHDWQTDTSKPTDVKDCDILEVYGENDKNRLKNSVTTIDWSIFITNDSKIIGTAGGEDETEIQFTDEATQEFQHLIDAEASRGKSTIIIDECEEINIDDI
jgi:translation initiation factor IF-1